MPGKHYSDFLDLHTTCTTHWNTNRGNSDSHTNEWRAHLRWRRELGYTILEGKKYVFCRHVNKNVIEAYPAPIGQDGFGPIKIMEDQNDLLQIPIPHTVMKEWLLVNGAITKIEKNGCGGYKIIMPGQDS